MTKEDIDTEILQSPHNIVYTYHYQRGSVEIWELTPPVLHNDPFAGFEEHKYANVIRIKDSVILSQTIPTINDAFTHCLFIKEHYQLGAMINGM